MEHMDHCNFCCISFPSCITIRLLCLLSQNENWISNKYDAYQKSETLNEFFFLFFPYETYICCRAE